MGSSLMSISSILPSIFMCNVSPSIPACMNATGMEGETLHMNMEGRIEKILIKLDPKIYWEYIRTEKGKYVLYVDFKKALYVTLQADLLFCQNPTSILQEWGFKINPYDWCV